MSFGPPPPPSAWTHSATAQESRRKRTRYRFIGMAVATTVLVASSMAGVWFMLSRTDDQPDSKSPQTARQLPGDVAESVEKPPADLSATALIYRTADSTPKEGVSGNYGTWLTKKFIARARIDEKRAYIEAYRLQRTDGMLQKWKIPLGGGLCGTTRHVTVDGRTALVTEYTGSDGRPTCGRLVVVDLDHGKLLWSAKIPNKISDTSDSWGITLSRNVAAISWDGGSAAYDLTSRKKLWSDTQASKCEIQGFAGGRQLLAVIGCVVAGSDRKDLKVAKIDPQSGRHLWVYSPGSFGHVAINLVSTQPATLVLYSVNDGSPSHLITLNEKGRHQSTIRLNSDIHAINCPRDDVNQERLDFCRGITVSNRYAFLTTSVRADTSQPTNSIAAFDLKTGKGVTRFDSPDLGGSLNVFQANGDHALAIQEGALWDASPYVVYELQVKDTKRVPFMFFSSEDKWNPAYDQHDFLFKNGMLAIGTFAPEEGQLGELVMLSRARFSQMPVIKAPTASN